MNSDWFPVGYHRLHPTKIIDFQLNRWHSLGYCRLEDMRAAGQQIRSLADWKPVLARLAGQALAEERMVNATFLYRAAEFFTAPGDPDKLALYDQFLRLFYTYCCAKEDTEQWVPYDKGRLPALHLPPRGTLRRGSLVIHGGFDSFIEEFYLMGRFFAEQGYEVVLFEGPGQGGALRHYDLALDYAWEKPAAAVLDHFGLEDVTWLGISMGGWLCFRAAAYEPRISRVIASSIAYDYMQIPPAPVAAFARWLMQYPQLMQTLSEWKMRARPQERWGIENLMYITRTDNALDAAQVLLQFNAENLKSDRVRQDVLILTGAEDHFIPLKMHRLQVAALSNVRSLSERIFTRAEQGQNHCQVGNIGLALQVMADWMNNCGQQQPVPLAAGMAS